MHWSRLLGALLFANVAAGLLFSPATAATKVMVSGARPNDKALIDRAAQGLRGVPCVRVDAGALEERILSNPAVARAALGRNPFGRARIDVVYEKPVARLEGEEEVVLVATGKLVRWPEPDAHLPKVRLPDGAERMVGTFAGGYEALRVAEVCSRASELPLGDRSVLIVCEAGGKVSLRWGSRGSAVLGFPDTLDEKFTRLTQLLEERPALLEGGEVNLVTPARPTVRPR